MFVYAISYRKIQSVHLWILFMEFYRTNFILDK